MGSKGAAPRTPAAPAASAAVVLVTLAFANSWFAAGPASRTAAAETRAVPADGGVFQAIAIAEDQRRLAGLVPHLRHREAAVRARAALAVGRLQDSTSVPALLPLLGDAAPEVRREAVFALGQIGHRSARAAVEDRLADGDPETVELAIEALGKIGDRAATPRITSFLGDPLASRRAHAAVALWRLADSTAIDALLGRRDDPDAEVRWRVLYALEKVVAPARVVLPVALYLDDPDLRVRAHAVRTLGRQKATRATAYLAGALRDADVGVVVNAMRALQQIGDTIRGRWPDELAPLLAHPHPYVRVTAATSLAERAPWVAADSASRARGERALAERLTDSDAATRGNAARALLARRGAAALSEVAPVLDDSSLTARTLALRGLPHAGEALALEALRPRLAADRPLAERMAAAEVLGELGSRSALPALRSALADTSALFLSAAVAALGTLRDSASVPALARAYAAHAADADADVRLAIRDALRELAGARFADSLERAHPARNAAPASHPADFATPPAERGAVLHTTAGIIEWSFFGAAAPQTVRNFVRLAERGYFDGRVVHRVVPNFVIQDGDPTGTGSGGPGYTIRCEYNRLRYGPGMVGMALSGKDTGGSQWFITHSAQPHLDGRYTIFARVIRGFDVVGRVVQGDRVTKVEILR